MMLSGVMMLQHLGETKVADKLEKAVAQVIAEGKNVTYDMKPNVPNAKVVGTSQVADAVIERLRELKNT
jgi:isocitrate dehydrogenase (NAD+)